jgi:hypothetical protein
MERLHKYHLCANCVFPVADGFALMQLKSSGFRGEIPKFLAPDLCFDAFYLINIANLYVGLRQVSGGRVVYVLVYKTPHYVFARNVLFKENLYPVSGYQSYKQYSEINPTACSGKQFVDLIRDVTDNGYDWKNRPILVYRHWSRLFPLGRWDVADGFHRLAVLAAIGEKNIIVGTLRYKYNAGARLKRSLFGG